jgi:hypothetical protein
MSEELLFLGQSLDARVEHHVTHGRVLLEFVRQRRPVQTEHDWSIESSTWRYEHCRVEVVGRTSGLFRQTFNHAPPDLRE